MMMLTRRQREVYEFIRAYVARVGVAPSYEEIRRHFGFRSLNSVQKHLKRLAEKGVIRSPWGNQKRALTLVDWERSGTVELPLLGLVAAGRPLEAVEQSGTVEVPQAMLHHGEHYALEVEGQSMIEDGILDGDLLIVKRQETADEGQTVVALVDGEATVKRFYRTGEGIELRPANAALSPIVVTGGEFAIRGVVVGLVRSYGASHRTS
jgi:repressor LexA